MDLYSTTGMITFMQRMQQKLRPHYRRRHWGSRQLLRDVLKLYRLLTDDALMASLRTPEGGYDLSLLTPLARNSFGHRRQVTDHVLWLLHEAEVLCDSE